MLPAVSYADILSRTPAFGTEGNPLGQRLVSLLFARPSSPVWRDLETNRALLDQRSGGAWDLFFVGMSAYAAMEADAMLLSSTRATRLYMNPAAFQAVEGVVAKEHRNAVASDGRPHEAWHYSGETDLVSFMCYSRTPDWLSLRSIRLEEEATTGRPLSLGRVTEGLSRWQRGDLDQDLAPGHFLPSRREPFATSLEEALSWSASAVAGGALGNSAYDLIRLLLQG